MRMNSVENQGRTITLKELQKAGLKVFRSHRHYTDVEYDMYFYAWDEIKQTKFGDEIGEAGNEEYEDSTGDKFNIEEFAKLAKKDAIYERLAIAIPSSTYFYTIG